MKTIITLLIWSAALCRAAEIAPQEIHPKIFQMVQCWISDTSSPVITEVNLDAVRANRNQFDYKSVKSEDGWITFQDGKEMLRFKVIASSGDSYTITYQENGGGSLTTEQVIKFRICPRKIEVDGVEREITVLHVLAIKSDK